MGMEKKKESVDVVVSNGHVNGSSGKNGSGGSGGLVKSFEDELRDPPRSSGVGTNSENYDDLKLVFTEIFSDKDIELKSVLGKRLLKHMIRAVIYNEQYPTQNMTLLIKAVLKYKVSEKGRGRTDLVEILKAISNKGKDDKAVEQKNFIQRSLGL